MRSHFATSKPNPSSRVTRKRNCLGNRRHVIQDIADYERYEVERTLFAQLDYGKRVADERGTLTTEQVRDIFAERFAQEG